MSRLGEQRSRKRASLLVGGLLVFTASAGAILWLALQCLSQTGGVFSYALDDPYIHLSIARNFALHGVWGITPFEPASACSSPLWALILSVLIRVFGDWSFWPLVLGIGCSLAVPLLLYVRLVRSGFHPLPAGLGALAPFAVGPLAVLPFTGMEHSIQVLLDFLFLFWIWDQLEGVRRKQDSLIGFSLAFLICLCRFESVFLVVIPFLVFAFRREWKTSMLLALGPIAAIGGFALFSKLMGMPLLPNSLVLKGNVSHPLTAGWFLNMYLNLRGRSFPLFDLFVLTVGLGFSLRFSRLRESTRSLQILCLVVVTATVLHCGFALVGIFYRYEAYLTCLLIFWCVVAIRQWTEFAKGWSEIPVSQPRWLMAIGAAVLAHLILLPVLWIYQLNANLIVSIYGVGLAMLIAMETGPKNAARLSRTFLQTMFPLALYFIARNRGVPAGIEVSNASRDIYTQQFQMARFVNEIHPDGRVVVNDIGAMSYFTKAHIFDLWGLATNSVRDLKLTDNWKTSTMKQEIDRFGPDIIIAYPDWYKKNRAMPSSLIPVATWTIPPVTTAAKPVVEFWAPSAQAAMEIQKRMRQFERRLPEQVKVKYLTLPQS